MLKKALVISAIAASSFFAVAQAQAASIQIQLPHASISLGVPVPVFYTGYRVNPYYAPAPRMMPRHVNWRPAPPPPRRIAPQPPRRLAPPGPRR